MSICTIIDYNVNQLSFDMNQYKGKERFLQENLGQLINFIN